MSAYTYYNIYVLALGFATAGVLSSGYQWLFEKNPSFHLLGLPQKPKAIAAVPFLVFAAPFIIMRNTLRGRVIEARRFEFVTLATVIAGVWSLMSGTVLVQMLQGLGL